MGILDDLAMGFGLKERTKDYDARTARTIAASEAAARRGDANNTMFLAQARNPSHSSYIGDDAGSSGGARVFLDRVGGTGYNPQVADDNRSFMQRLLFSPESEASPTRYAIGPMEMDQPLPQFGIFGLLSSLSNFNRKNVPTVSADTSPMRVRPGYTGGQPETTFDIRTEEVPIDYSDGIPVQDPATIAAVEALNSVSDTPTLPSAPSILADPTGELSSMNNVDPLRPKDMGVDKYGRRIPVELPVGQVVSPPLLSDETGYYDQQLNMGVGTDELFVPSQASDASIPLEDLPQGLPGVQLGAYNTVSDASAAYQRLINQNPQLSSYQPLIEKSKSGDREYYRLRIKGLDDISQARDIAYGLTGVDAYPVFGKVVR